MNAEFGMRPALARRFLVCTTKPDGLKEKFLSFELSLESRSGPGNGENEMVECLIFIISAILIRVGAAFSRDK
jgi:hypothetical protein